MRSTEERRRFHRPRLSVYSVPWTRLWSWTLVSFSVLSCVTAQEYVVPQATLEALTPRGLRVSIPDSTGVQLFAFHGNINKPIHNVEAGDLSVDINSKTGDRWVYINDRVRLKLGDTINYWTYVQVYGRGYRLDEQTWQVTEMVSADSPIGSSGSFAVLPTEETYVRPTTSFAGSGSSGNFAGNYPANGGNSNFGSFGANEGSNSRPNNGGGSTSTFSNAGNNRPINSGGNNRPTGSSGNFGGNNRPVENFGANRPAENFGGNNRPVDTFGGNNRPVENFGGNNRPVESFSGNNRPVESFSGNNRPVESFSGNNRPVESFSGNNRPVESFGNTDGFGSFDRPTDTSVNGEIGGSRPNGNIGDTDNSNLNRPKPVKTQTNRPSTSATAPTPAQHCVLSTTTVNGRPACKNYVIFEETFKSLDLRRWARDVRIPSHPDFEFCVFSEELDTLGVQNDALHIRPRLTEDRYGEDFVRTGNLVLEGCTAGPTNAESCSRQAVFSYILPPTLSARVNTKDSFRFRYGVVEIRAKLPLGDWIYPEILLLPYQEQYGAGISSGRVQLAMARGNRQLSYPSSSGTTRGSQLGAKRLEYGVMAGSAAKILHREANRQWADQFHNYSLLWTPETMAFSVDGVELGIIRPESYGGLLRSENGRDSWSNGEALAPFDKEFYLSLGLAVGGVRTFPDDTVTSGGIDKPWSNTDAKAMLRFWEAKDQWYPTWGNGSQLIVESIRVTALNH